MAVQLQNTICCRHSPVSMRQPIQRNPAQARIPSGKPRPHSVRLSKEYKCIIVLKGANTSIATPEGKVFFNSTGNPGMATAGSGDTLTGILLSLCAQGYTPENAAVVGVYLHGLAGDIAAEEFGYESIIASDIINCLSKAFNRIKEP